MKKLKRLEIIAILSASAMSVMAIMVFFDLAILLIIFYFISVGFVWMYIFSFFETLVSLIVRGLNATKVKLLAHLSTVLIIVLLILLSSDVFKSRRVLTARLYDDLFNYTLVFRENGECEMNIIGMFAYQEDIKGSYYQKGDTIIFTKKPYDNDFIPDTMLIDREKKALFLYRDSIGDFTSKRDWCCYFEIVE